MEMGDIYSKGPSASAATKGWGEISGSTLKLVGIVTMLIDHIAAAVILRVILSRGGPQQLYDIYNLMRLVGRLSFPIFCFLLVEGFGKTKNRVKYASRLALFAFIAEIPFDLAFNAKVLEFRSQNVFLTLFLGLLALCAIEFLDKHKLPEIVRFLSCAVGVVASSVWLKNFSWEYIQKYILPYVTEYIGSWNVDLESIVVWGFCILLMIPLLAYGRRKGMDMLLAAGTKLAVVGMAVWLADIMHTDYAGMGVLTIIVIYIFRRHKVFAMACGCAVLTLMNLIEYPAFITLILVSRYNGKRGLKLKYFFYVFYPAHLMILWLVAWFMGTSAIPV